METEIESLKRRRLILNEAMCRVSREVEAARAECATLQAVLPKLPPHEAATVRLRIQSLREQIDEAPALLDALYQKLGLVSQRLETLQATHPAPVMTPAISQTIH